MKSTIIILALGLASTGYAQTNRVSHYSHSGSTNTLNIFANPDNMGCGEHNFKEYEPPTPIQLEAIKLDSTASDSLKIDSLVCKDPKLKKVSPLPRISTPASGVKSVKTSTDWFSEWFRQED
jgi:hypothetical protein